MHSATIIIKLSHLNSLFSIGTQRASALQQQDAMVMRRETGADRIGAAVARDQRAGPPEQRHQAMTRHRLCRGT